MVNKCERLNCAHILKIKIIKKLMNSFTIKKMTYLFRSLPHEHSLFRGQDNGDGLLNFKEPINNFFSETILSKASV